MFYTKTTQNEFLNRTYSMVTAGQVSKPVRYLSLSDKTSYLRICLFLNSIRLCTVYVRSSHLVL